MTQQAFSVSEFCRAYGIGRNKFYEELKAGRGPKTFRVGRRRLISRESADAWIRKLEAESSR